MSSVKSILIFLITIITIPITAQVAWLYPINPGTHETVTLTYNTNMGNMSLAGYEDDIYMHTGIITDKSIDGGDWKHVVGNWGEDDSRTKMTYIGNGLYEFTFVISDFYGLADDEIAQQIALVFRNENGSKVGKTATNEDVFLPVNGYIPPPPEEKKYSYDNRKYISYLFHDDKIDILTNNGITQVIPYSSNIIEVKHFTTSVIRNDSSSAIIIEPSKVFLNIDDTEDQLTISTDSLTIIANKDPFFLKFIYNKNTILEEEKGLFERSDTDGLRFKITDNEKIYGLGERANALNLVGGKYNMYNRPKYGYEIGAKNLNYSVPLVVSSNKYLLLFDNPQKGYADIGETENGIMEWAAIGGTMKYTLIAGNDYKSLASKYASLTGHQPLPPLWAMGNLISRMGYRNQQETDSIVNMMQEENFPIDAVIIDLYWFGDSLLGTMGRLNWYSPAWPEPEKMISTFRDKGVKTVLITEPYILDSLDNFKITEELGLLATNDKGEAYVNEGFYFGNGALLDIFKPEAADWFWQQYKKQMDIGVAGWWGDLGEPENHPSDQIHVAGTADEIHNIYGHYWHSALFNNFRNDYPEMRLFNLNRAGFAGSQRYSIFPWTGDVSRSWGGLQAQLPLMIHMSLSGLPYIHSDAGGFAQGTKDEELYTRWLQMSCFSPILRPHGSGVPSEPVFFNDTTKNIVRNFMKLRYSLLPYIYTTASEATLYGYPIVRPLFFEFPNDTNTYSSDSEYMFGPSIMVSPVVEQGKKNQNIYLPAGIIWYNWWTNKSEKGGNTVDYNLDLNTIPIFVKAGSFIPTTTPVNSTDDYSTENLKIKYYLNKDSDSDTYTMFVDDGKTFGTIEKGNYENLIFNRKNISANTDKFTFTTSNYGYEESPNKREICLELIGYSHNDKIMVKQNGKELGKIKNTDKKNSGYFYDKELGIWKIMFSWDSENEEIIISY